MTNGYVGAYVSLMTEGQVGGLGDVVTGLARACLSRGHNLEVMLPFYESLPEDQIEGLQHDRDFDCPKVTCLGSFSCLGDHQHLC